MFYKITGDYLPPPAHAQAHPAQAQAQAQLLPPLRDPPPPLLVETGTGFVTSVTVPVKESIFDTMLCDVDSNPVAMELASCLRDDVAFPGSAGMPAPPLEYSYP